MTRRAAPLQSAWSARWEPVGGIGRLRGDPAVLRVAASPPVGAQRHAAMRAQRLAWAPARSAIRTCCRRRCPGGLLKRADRCAGRTARQGRRPALRGGGRRMCAADRRGVPVAAVPPAARRLVVAPPASARPRTTAWVTQTMRDIHATGARDDRGGPMLGSVSLVGDDARCHGARHRYGILGSALRPRPGSRVTTPDTSDDHEMRYKTTP